VAALTLAASVGAGGAALASASPRGAAAATPARVALPHSYLPARAARATGRHTAPRMSVELVLRPGDGSALAAALAAVYDPSSPNYHHWLPKGAFALRYAPTVGAITGVERFLTRAGLRYETTTSRFLLRAVGSAARIAAAFGTHLENYRTGAGRTFFANTSPASVPRAIAGSVLGVVGLTDTSRATDQVRVAPRLLHHSGAASPGYGAGPGGSGLSPAQTASMYGAAGLFAHGASGQGGGRQVAVFELSGYTGGDIDVWAHHFYGPTYHPHLVTRTVDGGPIHSHCPAGDSCPPPPDYSGDIEVEADIEQVMAVSPAVADILVYNAPNDETGQTELDEYTAIANDDTADTVSSSWAECEDDAGAGELLAENIIFEQMALQGQSMFSSAGDTGPYACLNDEGSPYQSDVTVLDPASQPWVTGVGGTSWSVYDPAQMSDPAYPTGDETVWDPGNGCVYNSDYCGLLGAGGGGVSQFWPQPAYQQGYGVDDPSYAETAPYCAFATSGQQCREVPDVSADADEFTGYAEYCTGNPNTNSTCATLYSTPAGWFGIGGTSLSSPLWASVIADWDSYHDQRFGNANVGLYALFNDHGYRQGLFHDVTGVHQTENSNGFYPTTGGYDMSTGIGTPDISAIGEASLPATG
jgi:kumamolisin